MSAAETMAAGPHTATAPGWGLAGRAFALTLAGGWLVLAARAAVPPDGTPAGFLTTPALWPARLPPALAETLPAWVAATLSGLALGMGLFLAAAGARLVLMAAGRRQGALVAALAAAGAIGLLLSARAGGPVALPAAAAVLAALAVLGLARVAAGAAAPRRSLAALATLAAAFVALAGLVRAWPAVLPALPPALGPFGAFDWQGQALPQADLLALGIGLVAAALLRLGLHATRGGLVLRARDQDPEMAAALGHGGRGAAVLAGLAGLAALAAGAALWALDRTAAGAGEAGGDGAGGAFLVMILATALLPRDGAPAATLPAGLLVGLAAAYGAALAAPPLGWVPAGILLLLALAGRD